MPKTTLPKTFKGWLVALGGAMAGLLAGFVTVNWLGRIVK